MTADGSGVFGDLLNTTNLLAKVEHDLERLRRNPTDAYAAFDFFVTAEHLPDWAGSPTGFRSSNPLLRVVSHVANGAKHFAVDPKRHHSVESSAAVHGAFQADAFQADAFDIGGLVLRLTGEEADEARSWLAATAGGWGDSSALDRLWGVDGCEVNVLPFAELVVAFWKAEIGTPI